MIEYVWLISSIEKMLTGGKKYDIKKNIQSFLSIMLVVFLTAGCGGANGTADNSSSTSTNSPSADSMTVKEESNLV